MLKAKLAGLVVAGFLLGTAAAYAEEFAFPGSVDEAGIRLPSESTYADRYRNELEQSVTATDFAFPGSVDEAGIRLPSKSTRADRYGNELAQSATTTTVADFAFPGSVDEAGIRLPSKTTYADQHRGGNDRSLRTGSNTSVFPKSNATN